MSKIPKLIHYCWFGYSEKPQLVLDCIETWKKHLPGWKIIEWNESNFDINKYQYVQDAYKYKKWAFVSDVARLDILYRFGGVYLDVDVEFIKELPDEYLDYEGFLGFEYTHYVAPGLIFGVKKNNKFIKELLNSYQFEHFQFNKEGVYETINLRLTKKLQKNGLNNNGKCQVVCGFHIFPSEYFCGYNTDLHEPEITINTICWHHYLGSWSKPTLKSKFQNFLKVIIGKNKYKKLLHMKRRLRF